MAHTGTPSPEPSDTWRRWIGDPWLGLWFEAQYFTTGSLLRYVKRIAAWVDARLETGRLTIMSGQDRPLVRRWLYSSDGLLDRVSRWMDELAARLDNHQRGLSESASDWPFYPGPQRLFLRRMLKTERRSLVARMRFAAERRSELYAATEFRACEASNPRYPSVPPRNHARSMGIAELHAKYPWATPFDELLVGEGWDQACRFFQDTLDNADKAAAQACRDATRENN